MTALPHTCILAGFLTRGPAAKASSSVWPFHFPFPPRGRQTKLSIDVRFHSGRGSGVCVSPADAVPVGVTNNFSSLATTHHPG